MQKTGRFKVSCGRGFDMQSLIFIECNTCNTRENEGTRSLTVVTQFLLTEITLVATSVMNVTSSLFPLTIARKFTPR